MALWAAVGSGRVLGDWDVDQAEGGGRAKRNSTFATGGGIGSGGGRAEADRDADRGRAPSQVLPRKTLSGTEFDRSEARREAAARQGKFARQKAAAKRARPSGAADPLGDLNEDDDRVGVSSSGDAGLILRSHSLTPEELECLQQDDATCFGLIRITLDPDGRFRVLWDLALGLLILYSVISIPIRIGFDVAPEIPNSWQFIVDCCIDCTFAADICLNFLTGFYVGKTLVRNKREIARAYVRGWFTIDLVTTVPIDLFVELAVGGGSDLRAIKMVRILRLLKLARLKKLGKVSQRVREKLNVNAALAELASVLLGIVFFAHLLCCFWYFVGHLAYLDGHMSWVRNLDLGESSLTDKYTASLYWAVATMTAVGYGDVYAFSDNERLYAIFTEIVGAIVFGFLIGNISNLLDQMDRRASTSQRRLNVVTMYCKVREVPALLTKRVRRHMDYYLSHTSVFPENTILEQLTPKLRHYCVLQSNKEDRHKQIIFQRVPAAFVVDVAQRWMPVQVPPHTVLSREGEVGGDVFFVKTGSLNVMRLRAGSAGGAKKPGNTLIAVVAPGGFVGEASALYERSRKATVVSSSHSELYCIGASVLKDIVHRYPEVRDKFEDPLEGQREDELDEEGRGEDNAAARGGSSLPQEEPAASSPSGVDLALASGGSFAARGRASKVSRKWGGDPAGSGPLELMRGAVGEDQSGEGAVGPSGGGASGGAWGGGKGPDQSQQRVLIQTRRKKRDSGVLARRFGGGDMDVRDSVDTVASAELYSPTLAAQTRTSFFDSMGLTRSGSIPEGTTRYDVLTLEEVQEDDWSLAQRLVLRPDGTAKARWDILLTVAIVYSVISVPYLLGFEVEPEGGLAVFDIVVDVFFMLDIAVNFRTAYYEDSTRVLVTMAGSMAHRYMTSAWFYVDVISGVPFDKLARAFQGPSAGGDNNLTLRTLKMVRILRLGRLLKLMKVSSLNTLLEEELGMNPAVIGLGKLGLQVAYIAHLLACGWHAASSAQVGACTTDYDCNWVDVELSGDGYVAGERGASSLYLASFYWCFTTMTTVGYGDVIPGTSAERAFAIFAMLVGVTVFGYIVGSMANIVRTLGEADNLFKSKIDEVKEYLKEQDITGELETRVRAHYEQRLEERTVFDEDAILRQLPHYLRRQVMLHVYRGAWRPSPFFEHIEETDLQCVLDLCPIGVMLRHDLVTLEGDAADFAFLILFGSVEVVGFDASFVAGDFVGADLVLKEGAAWEHEMVVSKKCILLQIHRPSLLALRVTLPAVARQLEHNLRKVARLGAQSAAGGQTFGASSLRSKSMRRN